ncbi:MAG: hypothetical protein C0514_07750 [Candidatus Puniceispirillum sp.]|nr:hypothetical protein [Candidatus Puniceispirillum sp.]
MIMTGALAEFIHLVRAPFEAGTPFLMHHPAGVGLIFVALVAALCIGALMWRFSHRRTSKLTHAWQDACTHLPQGYVQWREGQGHFTQAFLDALMLARPVKTFSDLQDLAHAEDAAQFEHMVTQCTCGPQKAWVRFLTHHGYHYFDVSAACMPHAKGAQMRLYLVDQDAIKRPLVALEEKAANCESQSKLMTQILESLPLPLWVFEKESHNIAYCNQAYCDTLEMPKQQILESSTHLVNQDGGDDFWKKSSGLHYLNVRGQRRCYELKRVPLEAEKSFLAFAFDRSAEDSLERKLKRHLSLYREVLETLSAGVTVYGPDRKLRFFNHAYARMFGMDESWLSGEPSIGEVLDDLNRRRLLVEHTDYPAFKRREMGIISGLLSPMQELCYLPDGRTIRKITAPHPSGGIFYIFEDVSSSLELERRFNIQIDVQRSTLDNLYEGIAVFGGDLRLRFTNPSFRKLWHWTPDGDADRRHIRDLVEHVKEHLAYEGTWDLYKDKLIARVSDRVPKKRRLNRNDGTVIDFAYVPLPDGSHLLSFVDVTDSCRIAELEKASA